jgi:DNA-directed RNA polymerase specialized sigma24 family protein
MFVAAVRITVRWIIQHDQDAQDLVQEALINGQNSGDLRNRSHQINARDERPIRPQLIRRWLRAKSTLVCRLRLQKHPGVLS